MSTQLALLLVGGAATFLFLMLALVGPRYRPRPGTGAAEVAEVSQASEIAADRDRLRAEHAVEVHRLERRMHRLEEVLAEVRIADARTGGPLLVLNSEEFDNRANSEAMLRADLQMARAEADIARAARERLEQQLSDLTLERDRLAAASAAGQAGDRVETARITTERDAAQAELSTRTRERDEARAALEIARREKDVAVASRGAGEDSAKLTARIAELERVAADRATLLKRRDRDLAAAQVRATAAEAERGAALDRIETLTAQHRAAEQRARDLEEALSAVDPALVAGLRQRVATLEGSLETTEQRLEAAEGELDIVRIERAASATRIEMLERLLAERNAARTHGAGEGDASLRASLDLAQRDLDSARAARAAAEEARIVAEAEARRLSGEVERLGGLAAEAGRLRTEQREDDMLRRRLNEVAADVVRLASALGESGDKSMPDGRLKVQAKA
ncbi:hypothetical protein ACRC7T_06020 [Segnochrobactraceae bacterium EtOH-i3]